MCVSYAHYFESKDQDTYHKRETTARLLRRCTQKTGKEKWQRSIHWYCIPRDTMHKGDNGRERGKETPTPELCLFLSYETSHVEARTWSSHVSDRREMPVCRKCVSESCPSSVVSHKGAEIPSILFPCFSHTNYFHCPFYGLFRSLLSRVKRCRGNIKAENSHHRQQERRKKSHRAWGNHHLSLSPSERSSFIRIKRSRRQWSQCCPRITVSERGWERQNRRVRMWVSNCTTNLWDFISKERTQE